MRIEYIRQASLDINLNDLWEQIGRFPYPINKNEAILAMRTKKREFRDNKSKQKARVNKDNIKCWSAVIFTVSYLANFKLR